jgi:hypothetical protein
MEIKVLEVEMRASVSLRRHQGCIRTASLRQKDEQKFENPWKIYW